MFGILLSAFNAVLGFVLKSVVLKWGALFVIFFIVQALASFAISYLPSVSGISGMLGGVGSDVAYWLTPWRIDYGISGVVSSMAIRFLIRRIPIIG
jgi:hypothetical protein